MQNAIQVYRYDLAPQELRDIANLGEGGNEDWIVVIPVDLIEEIDGVETPEWIQHMDTYMNPTRIALPNGGGIMYVGCH